ncbi:MAG: hypothetical protein KF824_06970 [Fimbriimonadaceae bacterium]|nr:MAG: hypothetical protein KF824_06970 [Fimbriimonadaceae bacterium]
MSQKHLCCISIQGIIGFVKDVVFTANKAKLLFVVIAGLTFAALGIWMISSESKTSDTLTLTLIGWAGIVFFGGGTLFFVFRWIQLGNPTLTINEDGFLNRTLGGKPEMVKWDDVANISQMSIGQQKFVVVDIYEDAEISRDPKLRLKELRRNSASGFGNSILVLTNLLAKSDQDIFEKMEEIWRATGHPGKRWSSTS